MKARDIIFTALVGFLVTWSALSAFSLVQALVGFTDTYAELVTKYQPLQRMRRGKRPCKP